MAPARQRDHRVLGLAVVVAVAGALNLRPTGEPLEPAAVRAEARA